MRIPPPTFAFEAIDPSGQPVEENIRAPNEAEARATIGRLGYDLKTIAFVHSDSDHLVPLRLLVMGTGPFGVPMFRRLVESGRQIAALVTQPDRPTHGRSSVPRNPMRELAEQHGLDVLSPDSINTPEANAKLTDHKCDLLVVCDYGQILKPDTLRTTRMGGINLHGSLLPKYRGAAPIQWAIYHGETETGVSVLHITPQLDAGPVIVQLRTPIGAAETAAQLEPRLAELGAQAIDTALGELEVHEITSAVVQEPALASKAPRLKKSDGLIDWHRPAAAIFNQVRAFQPWPKSFTFWQPLDGPPLRLILDTVAPLPAAEAAPPGTVLAAEKQLIVACGEGRLEIQQLQPAGKRVLPVVEFLRGYPVRPGQVFGDGVAGAGP